MTSSSTRSAFDAREMSAAAGTAIGRAAFTGTVRLWKGLCRRSVSLRVVEWARRLFWCPDRLVVLHGGGVARNASAVCADSATGWTGRAKARAAPHAPA